MVPTDIFDYILSLLHSDQDYTSLETCSIVFPQFVNRHLYSQITLDIVNGGLVSILPLTDIYYHRFQPTYYIVDPTNFFHLLVDHPHVATYVRLVQIIIGNTKGQAPNYNLILQQLVDRFSFTASILSILPHPESILVEAHGLRPSWHLLSSEFSTAFQNSIRLPSVKSVVIFNMRDLSLDYFDDCKNLKNLYLDGSFLHGDSVSTSPYPRLCSLHIDRYDNLTRAASWLKSNTLHTLSLRPFGGSIPNVQILIEACSKTLVNLDINHKYNYLRGDVLSTPFPDLQLPFLDHLTFHSVLDGPGRMNISPLSLLVPFLGSIKTLSPRSPICLTLHLHLCHHDPDWSLVTPVLTLPTIRHPVELYFACYPSVRDLFFDVVSLLQQNSDMKSMLKEGKLVTFINDFYI